MNFKKGGLFVISTFQEGGTERQEEIRVVPLRGRRPMSLQCVEKGLGGSTTKRDGAQKMRCWSSGFLLRTRQSHWKVYCGPEGKYGMSRVVCHTFICFEYLVTSWWQLGRWSLARGGMQA